MSTRADLASELQAALGDGFTVYDHPPDVVTPPALVIRPGSPYKTPLVAGGVLSMMWICDIDIVARRYQEDEGLQLLEELRQAVAQSLPARWRWFEFGDLGEVEVGGVEYLRGVLQVTTVTP